MRKTLITNVKIPDCKSGKIQVSDILFDDERILEISRHIEDGEARVISGDGDYLLPSFTDLSSDFSAPFGSAKENMETGSLSAYFGGYSDVLLTSGADTPCDNKKILDQISDIALRQARCRIHKSGALSLGTKGEELCNYGELHESGAVFFTDGPVVPNSKVLRQAMLACAAKDYPVILSPARDPLYADACVTEGRIAGLLKVGAEPPSAEARAVASYILLAEETGCRVHIRGISTAASAALIRFAKDRGVRITASTSPWYFSLTAEDTVFIGANAKVYPPLRSEKDRQKIIEALADGTIDAIDSDHRPCTKQEKSGAFSKAAFGAIGLQTVFSLAVTYLLLPGHIDIFRLCELLSLNPARILGIDPSYTVDTDCRAFNLANVSEEYILTNSYLKSRSFNCPYVGMSLCGNVRETFIL